MTELGIPTGVKAALTPKSRARARRRVENPDYASFVRRVLSAHGQRVYRGDIEGLADLEALSAELDRALRHAVTGLRQLGYSWADIGARLGTTRQAVQQRWGRPPTARPGGLDG
jgi:hypothetical protein